jgi:tRNA nucleotidyltransferase (CCA-adding enzyme)
VPKKQQQFAEKVTEFHGLIHKGLDGDGRPALKPKTYLKALTACGALKDLAAFEKLLTACEADAKGRLGFEQKPYPQKPFWLALAQAANRVDNQAILATGVQGADIGRAIDAERHHLIQDFISGQDAVS